VDVARQGSKEKMSDKFCRSPKLRPVSPDGHPLTITIGVKTERGIVTPMSDMDAESNIEFSNSFEKSPLSLVSNSKSLQDILSPKSETSAHTVCKDYTSEWMPQRSFDGTQTGGSSIAYSSFTKECGVALVIRSNFDSEPGMPRRSYDAARWKEFAIDHKNIQFEDHAGGLPAPADVCDLLEAADKMGKVSPGAVLIHCKGGFGRSVVLCCCLAIYNYDVPGSALLGWSRIARPGAITTPQQEEFLLSMKGRAEILKFAKKARRPSLGSNLSFEDKLDMKKATDGAKVGCSTGCAVQ
jgi:hypothetical protein